MHINKVFKINLLLFIAITFIYSYSCNNKSGGHRNESSETGSSIVGNGYERSLRIQTSGAESIYIEDDKPSMSLFSPPCNNCLFESAYKYWWAKDTTCDKIQKFSLIKCSQDRFQIHYYFYNDPPCQVPSGTMAILDKTYYFDSKTAAKCQYSLTKGENDNFDLMVKNCKLYTQASPVDICGADINSVVGTDYIDLSLYLVSVVTQKPKSVIYDFDGDKKADIGIYRPSDGTWHVWGSTVGTIPIVSFGGQSQDVATPGDYDGDGKTNASFYRYSSSPYWHIRLIGGTDDSRQFGADPASLTDIPVPADYDGDGKTDIAVFRKQEAKWYISGTKDGVIQKTIASFTGQALAGDLLIPADYNGDGKAEVAIFRPSNVTWYIEGQASLGFGTNGDIPVPQDYDGDGKADIAVYRASNKTWYIFGSKIGPIQKNLNVDAAYLVPADYNGDGKVEAAVVAMPDYKWHIEGMSMVDWGTTGDIPIPALYKAHSFQVP